MRKLHKTIIFTLDGYGAHVSFRSLSYLKFHNISTVAMLAHPRHRAQVLEYTLLSPYKNRFRNLLDERVLVREGDLRNDVYTLCEVIHEV